MIFSEEEINKNFQKALSFLKMTEDANLIKLFEDYKERYAVCPASTADEYYNSFPGGLCAHAIKTLSVLNHLILLYPDTTISKKQMIKVAFLMDFGKIGDENEEYFILTEKKWQLEKGINYEINSKISYMRIPHRTLNFCNQYNINLEKNEMLALLLTDSFADEANFSYKYREPLLAVLLREANYLAQLKQKGLKE